MITWIIIAAIKVKNKINHSKAEGAWGYSGCSEGRGCQLGEQDQAWPSQEARPTWQTHV